jgi:hypothetical protein
MRSLLLLIGVAAVAAGLLFIGQGRGFIRWPATSFMIDDRMWVTYGAGIALAGLLLIVIVVAAR